MNELEIARMELYKAIEFGDKNYILQISQYLDDIILNHMYLNKNTKLKNPA